MIVVDASVLVTALVDDGSDGRLVRRCIVTEELAAPELIDLEVLSAMRQLVQAKRVSRGRATDAVADLAALDLRRCSHRRLLERCWALRHNVTPYDAAYVALAEALEVPLLTADARLGRAPGTRCEIKVIGPT